MAWNQSLRSIRLYMTTLVLLGRKFDNHIYKNVFPLFYKIYIYFLFSTPFLYTFFFCSLYFTCKPTQHISVFIFMFGSINRYDLLLIHPFKDLAFILFPIFYKQLTILLYIKKKKKKFNEKLYVLWFSLIIKDSTHISISFNVLVN